MPKMIGFIDDEQSIVTQEYLINQINEAIRGIITSEQIDILYNELINPTLTVEGVEF